MPKNSKRELLCITVLLMALLSSSAYAYLIPSAHATEPTTSEKGLLILSNTVDLDLSKYVVTTKVYPQNYNASYLDVVPQTDVEYTLISEGSTVRTLCTFANYRLQMMHVLENEGSPHLSKTAANSLELAKNFLNNYQEYTADSFYGELLSTLDNVDASKNSTRTSGNIQLEVIANNGYTTFKWTYTFGNALASSKAVSLGFNNGFLTYFVDNWQLYTIGSTSMNLSEKEARAIALEIAKAHQWSLKLDADAFDTKNFNESNVCWTALFFDGSLYADKTRNEDPLTLYPVWRVGVALNKWYGQLYGITVDIWADTKEVRIVEEAWSTMSPPEGTPTANMTVVSEASIQEPTTAEAMPALIMWVALSTLAVVTVGTTSVWVCRKKLQSYNLPQLRSIKTSGKLLCVLILFIILLAPIATVGATTRAGVIWGSESAGAIDPDTGQSWRKSQTEIYWQTSMASTIASYFNQGGYDGYDQQGDPGSKKSNILGNITYLSNNHDCLAVVDFDHGVGRFDYSGDNNVFHFMVEDNTGTVIGAPGEEGVDWDYAPENGVYDMDIYSNNSQGKVSFAFINTCYSANLTRPSDGTPWQGLVNNKARGMPFAWMRRTAVDKDTSGFTTALNMSIDGYNEPDDGSQCYIGFPFGSASLQQLIPYSGGSQYYHQWVDRFFDYALRYDMSVNMALDHASLQTWTARFGDCYLRTGFQAYWWQPGGGGAWPNADCTMAVYGNGNAKLRYYSPGWTDNFNDNSIDATKWDELENGATASETTGQLVVTVPSSGTGQVQAGYVSKYAYGIKDREITIKVSEFDSLDEMILQICIGKTTSSDPYAQNSWYRILKARYDSKVYVQGRVDGGDVETKACMNWAGATGNLTINVCDGAIAFYENGYLRYAEPYALSSYDCHIYAFTSTLKERASGTDKFDDFALAPTPSFLDYFDDADNYYSWATTSGSWQVTNGHLRSTEYNSHIYVTQPFATDILVKADMETLTHTGDAWNVPWLYVKTQDANNRIYALIKVGGIVELSMIKNGEQTSWQVQSSNPTLDPYDVNVITVSIVGTNAKVWVNGKLYINESDANLATITGYAGIYTLYSTGEFDRFWYING